MEMVVARSFFGFIVGLLYALGRHVIPNRIADILLGVCMPEGFAVIQLSIVKGRQVGNV